MSDPMWTATWQAGALSAVSNVLGQIITCRQAQIPISIDLVTLRQFVLFTVLTTPPNFLWQAWLEDTFPGRNAPADGTQSDKTNDEKSTSGQTSALESTGTVKSRAGRNDETKAQKSSQPAAKQLNLRNTAFKFALDQTIGAAINLLLFLSVIPMMRGASLDDISANIQARFVPLTLDGQKVWPLVSILSFTVIPAQHRVVFGNVVGLFWGIYLSMVSAPGKK